MFLAAALLMPGITAGQPLSGDASRQLHHATGGVVSAAMLMQIITALLVWRAGHGSARYLAVRALLLVLIGVHAHRASGYKNLRTLGIYVRPSTDAVATALADLDPPRRRRR
ncbi:hypothetical protein AB0K12_39870 [Nonomuraea sp. NPDC049419]|uniref:hypothetical protein n=1 Tax=Nonomuraea sp. NPDC049419 TaxID=3155772 RepID=UPI0034179BC7